MLAIPGRIALTDMHPRRTGLDVAFHAAKMSRPFLQLPAFEHTSALREFAFSFKWSVRDSNPIREPVAHANYHAQAKRPHPTRADAPGITRQGWDFVSCCSSSRRKAVEKTQTCETKDRQ